MGSPSIFVYDCNNAGLILQCFNKFSSTREDEHEVSQKWLALAKKHA